MVAQRAGLAHCAETGCEGGWAYTTAKCASAFTTVATTSPVYVAFLFIPYLYILPAYFLYVRRIIEASDGSPRRFVSMFRSVNLRQGDDALESTHTKVFNAAYAGEADTEDAGNAAANVEGQSSVDSSAEVSNFSFGFDQEVDSAD